MKKIKFLKNFILIFLLLQNINGFSQQRNCGTMEYLSQQIEQNPSLIKKMQSDEIKEVVFALNTTMEGDTTNFYLYRKIKDFNAALTTIARGIAVGDELEFADEVTLGRSIQHRIPYEQSLPQ